MKVKNALPTPDSLIESFGVAFASIAEKHDLSGRAARAFLLLPSTRLGCAYYLNAGIRDGSLGFASEQTKEGEDG